MAFKIGDKVIGLDDYIDVRKGERYIIRAIEISASRNVTFYRVKGSAFWYCEGKQLGRIGYKNKPDKEHKDV